MFSWFVMIFFLFLLLVFSTPTYAVPIIHWDELEKKTYPIEETVIRIAGFLYQTEEGRWILRPQGGVRSCCLKKGIKVIVEGPMRSSPSQLVWIEGKLEQEALSSDTFILRQARLIN